MKERPILFSAPMVQALLAGRNTQTRRKIKAPASTGASVMVQGFWQSEPDGWWPLVSIDGESMDNGKGVEQPMACPYGKPGDRLWVRERGWISSNGLAFLPYAGNESSKKPASPDGTQYKPTPSIHMPRWASRITLEITEVRVQRLQEISEEDAKAEGISSADFYAWTLDAAAKAKTEPLCWIETPEGSSDEDYCRSCADKKLAEILATRTDPSDCFVYGGWNGYEADGPRFCKTCGVTLEVVYTNYAVEEELAHFLSYNAGPVGAYELNRLAGSISGEQQERKFSRIGYRWVWQSINGEGSWDANPWVWAVSFRRVEER